jgi:FG-GAP repeat
MNGASIVSSSFTSTPSVDNSWKITGTGDFNGDGKSDILWRNDLGTTSVWQMDGATVVSASLTSVPSVDNSWKIAAPLL